MLRGGVRTACSAKTGFTLTEILLAIAIVGVIAALVLPAVVTNYQNRALDIGFEREIKTISGAVRNLAVSENKVSFYSTMMYTASAQDTYDETSGKFIKKYLKVSKYCGDNNGDCFADKYYNYNETTHKKEVYEPVYKGACASLKNGASICITPQTSLGSISGLIDINGKKGPNVFDRDLRSFTIDSQFEKTSLGGGTSEVLSTPESDLEPKKPEEPEEPTPTPTPTPTPDPCLESSISKACCDTKTVKKGDACCIHYQSQVGHPCYEAPELKDPCLIDINSQACCNSKPLTSASDSCAKYFERVSYSCTAYRCSMQVMGAANEKIYKLRAYYSIISDKYVPRWSMLVIGTNSYTTMVNELEAKLDGYRDMYVEIADSSMKCVSDNSPVHNNASGYTEYIGYWPGKTSNKAPFNLSTSKWSGYFVCRKK